MNRLLVKHSHHCLCVCVCVKWDIDYKQVQLNPFLTLIPADCNGSEQQSLPGKPSNPGLGSILQCWTPAGAWWHHHYGWCHQAPLTLVMLVIPLPSPGSDHLSSRHEERHTTIQLTCSHAALPLITKEDSWSASQDRLFKLGREGEGRDNQFPPPPPKRNPDIVG